MQFVIQSIDSAFRSATESVYEEFFKDKDIIGKAFDTDDEMQEAIFKFEQDYSIDIESFSFVEETTEEEDEEEWNDTLSSALDEARETGRPFDHIMGEILGGAREEYCY